MKPYEVTYIVSDAIADEALGDVRSEVGKALEGLGAVIIKEEPWGKRKLAYPIKHRGFGNYITAQIHLEPAKIKDLDRFFRLNPAFLRHLIMVAATEPIKPTDEAELAESFTKRVEQQTTATEISPESPLAPESEAQVTTEPAPKKTRARKTIQTNEAKKKEEDAEERRKLVDEKLSEILKD